MQVQVIDVLICLFKKKSVLLAYDKKSPSTLLNVWEGREFLEGETEVKRTGRAISGLNFSGQWSMCGLLLGESLPQAASPALLDTFEGWKDDSQWVCVLAPWVMQRAGVPPLIHRDT